MTEPTTYIKSESQLVTARKLFRLTKELQDEFHETVEIQTILFFLSVATKAEAVDLTTISKEVGLTKASASRNYYRLSGGLRGGADGLGLIQSYDDPMDYRRKLLQLTSKGIELITKLEKIFH
jgi:DNA-binding MarR family transcriptional regulator